jgi:LDH2 family malate/lactate/ureidoglycolate dehydrogenase
MSATQPLDRVAAGDLRNFALQVMEQVGIPDDDRRTGAEAMIWAELRGAPRHGVSGRLPQLVQRIEAGAVAPSPRWSVVQETPASALLDAGGGWGQIAGGRGMGLAVAKARQSGVASVVVRNADITASLGHYADLAVQQHMLGFAICNTLPLMAPWGGAAKLLGNQPFAVGAPAARSHPMLFDSTVAGVSLGGVEAAHRRGEQLPAGVALDATGQPTVDPAEALAGSLLPMGGHRGYGIALAWEVLTGVLGGGRMAPDVGGEPMGVTLCCLAIDPAAFLPYAEFTARVDTLMETMHGATPASGGAEVRVPGQRGYAVAEEHTRDGIPIAATDAARLKDLGQRLGVAWIV